MNRTTAIVLTIITALCCGLPGLGLMCLGALAALGTQMPDVMAGQANSPQEVLIGAVFFICGGLIMLLIPIIVGFFSFRMSQPGEATPTVITYNEPLPPAS